MNILDDLQRARDALDAGNPEDALAILLDVWRECRSPAVAAAVDDVSFLAAERPLLAGKIPWQDDGAWLAGDKGNDPADLGPFLLVSHDMSSLSARKFVERLAKWPPDPRIGRRLVLALEILFFRGTGTRPYWSQLFRALPKHADPGICRRLRSLQGTYAARTSDEKAAVMFENGIRKVLKAIEKEKAPARELTAQEADALAAVRRSVGAKVDPQNPNDFLVAIAHDPDDDGLRQVFADWLLERGDERGEFINFQYQSLEGGLTKMQQKRERSLIHRHRRAWLGPVADVVRLKDIVFERGFPVECVATDATRADVRGTIGHPVWGTVRVLRDAQMIAWDDVVVHPVMRSLRVLYNTSFRLLRRLLRDDKERPLEVLVCSRESPDYGPNFPDLGWGEGLPALRHLGLGVAARQYPIWRTTAPRTTWALPERLRSFWPSPLARRLEVFEVTSAEETVPAWWRELEERADGLNARVVLITRSAKLHIERDTEGRWSRLRIECRVPDGTRDERTAEPETLAGWIDALGSDALTRLEVGGPLENVGPVEKAAKRQKRLDEVVITP